MNTKKIEALRKAIVLLQSAVPFDYDTMNELSFTGKHYCWGNPATCNNGFVLLGQGVSGNSILSSVSGSYKYYTTLGVCSVTGLPVGVVRDKMMEIGFDKNDIQNLEYLTDDSVLRSLNVSGLNHQNRLDVIRYMQAWVSILEEQDQKEQPKEVVKTVYIRVAVPASISEQAKELIGITETIAR